MTIRFLISHLRTAERRIRASGGGNGQTVRKGFTTSLIRLYNHCETKPRGADSTGLGAFTSLQFARTSLSARVSYRRNRA